MKRPLKTLFYGLTHEHADGKLRSVRRLPDEFEIVAVVDDRPCAPRHFCCAPADTSGLRVVSEPEVAELLPKIEVAFVETANPRLMPVAGLFAEHGIPLHCDKPCGESMEPYRTIAGKCRAAGIPMQIGYMYRANPAVRFCWRAVSEGWLGDIGFIEADMNHDYGTEGYAEFIGGFRGGILYNLGCHLVDIALPMVRGELRTVHAVLEDAPGDPLGSRTRGTALLSYPATDVLLRTSSAMPGSIACRRLRVDGSNGTIDLCPIERFDGVELALTMTLKEPRGGYPSGRSEVGFGVQSDRYAEQLRELAAIVRGERPNDPSQYDRDLAVHEVTLRMCGI